MLDINRENLSQESLCSGFVNKQKSYLQRTYGILDSAPKLTVIPDSKRELGGILIPFLKTVYYSQD